MDEQQRSKEFWDGYADVRPVKAAAIEAFAMARIRFLGKHIGSLKGLSVLDVGCGDGYISRHLMTRAQVVGIDLSSGMLARNPLPDKAMGSAYRLPFADNSFDLVFESNLFHHLEKPVDALLEMKRVSRRYVGVSEPNSNFLPMYFFHALKKSERGALPFCCRHLKNLYQQAGIELTAAENGGWVTPNRTPQWLLAALLWIEQKSSTGMFSMALGEVK